MKCFCCSQENWIKFNEFKLKKEMACCKNCGNLVYLTEPGDSKKLKEYYEKDYRKSPISVQHLITTNRKLNYIASFLEPWLKEQKSQLIVGDVGCATGFLVAWLRSKGHKATGSEWTTDMRRMCEHFYGFPATVELETKHKYDLIILYHTLEHMIEPDKKLEHYKSLLSENGVMMVSTPEWFSYLEEPGMGDVSTFQNVFHPDHIDIFTRKSLNNLFKKVGLKPFKEECHIYGQTYLLEKEKPGYAEIEKEDPAAILENLRKYDTAISFCNKEKFREAIDVWPKFPYAYAKLIFNSNLRKDTGRCRDVFKEAFENMPHEVNVKNAYLQWLYQQQEYKEAVQIGEEIIKAKRTDDIYIFLGHSYYQLKMYRKAMECYDAAAKLNPAQWKTAMGFICKAAVSMPAWDEIAEEQLKNQLFQQANVQLKTDDPAFKEIKQENGKEKKEETEKKEKINSRPQ